MEDPYAATTAWHLLLMLVTSLVTHWSHTGIPFLNQDLSQVSQHGCVGHSGTYSTPKLIPQVFNWVEVWNHGRPFRPLHSQILEVLCDDPGSVGASIVILEDGVRSQILEIWDRHWLQNLNPISHCIEIAFNDDKFCFACERDVR